MKFDWRRFCTDNKVPYVTSGPNTGRDHISVKCPYCGPSDPSEHMGLSTVIDNAAWGCLRNAAHRGRNPRRLVQRLLGCAFNAACALVEGQQSRNVDELDDALARLNAPKELFEAQADHNESFDMPKEFRKMRLSPTDRNVQRFVSYVAKRGFDSDAYDVCKQYDLPYALYGDYAWRLIFPIYFEGELRSWTGRDIREAARLRYRTKEESGKYLLFNWDRALEQMGVVDHVIFAEGPFDVVKLDYYGESCGATCVGGLGTSVTPAQVRLLLTLFKGFKHAWILFDAEAATQGFKLSEELKAHSSIPVTNLSLREFKDPGEMPRSAVRRMLSRLS